MDPLPCFSHSAIFGPPSLAACLTLWCCSPFTCLSSCLPVSPTATCPSACLQATCPSAYLQATCPPACLPLYSNQSSHQSAICQAEYCSFYLIPDKQIRPTLLSHSTALLSRSLSEISYERRLQLVIGLRPWRIRTRDPLLC